MKLQRHTDAAALLEAARPLLDAAGAAGDLQRGLLLELSRGSERYPATPYLALVCDDAGTPLSLALRTPPYPVLLTEATDQAVQLVAGDLQDEAPDLPGVVAPRDTASRFAAAWCARTGAASRHGLSLIVHQLTQVIPPRPCPGALRPAGADDRPLLEQWFDAFRSETGVSHPTPVEVEVASWLDQARAFLWQDQEPVSLVVRVGDTDTSARVAWVYTPPALRGRGYASNAVAAISSRLLAEGKQHLSLFTDAANPTSNHIYRAVGYAPRGEFLDLRFHAGDAAAGR